MTIAYSAISGSFAPLWFAHDQGLFAKHGVDAKIAYIQGNRVMLSALTASEIQAYQGGAEGLIRLVSGGGDGVFIATQYNLVNHYVLITDPGIARIEDLRGKRLALDPTSPTYGYMLKVLEKVGIRKDEVQFVQFGTAGQPERAAAVLRKQAAATILTAPNTYAAEKQGLRSFSAIRDLGDAFLARTMCAAEVLAARLHALPDDRHLAVKAPRREYVDRAGKGIKHMGRAADRDLERLVVGVAASLAGLHALDAVQVECPLLHKAPWASPRRA